MESYNKTQNTEVQNPEVQNKICAICNSLLTEKIYVVKIFRDLSVKSFNYLIMFKNPNACKKCLTELYETKYLLTKNDIYEAIEGAKNDKYISELPLVKLIKHTMINESLFAGFYLYSVDKDSLNKKSDPNDNYIISPNGLKLRYNSAEECENRIKSIIKAIDFNFNEKLSQFVIEVSLLKKNTMSTELHNEWFY